MKQKLLKSLLLVATMLVGSGNVWAYTPTLTNSYAVAGYQSKAYYNIANTNVDGMCPTEGDLRFRGSGYGLFNFQSGNRGADVTLSVTAGDIVIFEFQDSQAKGSTINSVSNCTKNEILSGTYLVYDVNTTASSVNVNVGRAGCIIAILVMESTGAPIHNYTINAVSGGTTIKQLASGTCEESAGFATYVPKAIFYGGQYYVLDDAGLTNYQASFTMSTSDAVEEVNYTLDESVVAFWEGENMSTVGHSAFNNRTDLEEASNGGAITPYSGTTNGIKTTSTIGKGVYNITIAVNRWADVATNYTLQYSTDNESWNDVEVVSFSSTSNAAYVADNIIIPSNSYLRLMSSASTPRHSIDYVLVEKLADIIDANDEFVGAFDKSQEWAESSHYTLKMGETKVFTFQNHGQDFGKNWKINVIEDGVWKSITRADSWDEKANGTGAATKVAYQVSKDGGSSRVSLDWAEYQEDMADAYVVATLSYGIDGTLAITTTSTGTANGYIYYVDQDVTGLTKDLEISLSINYSWLEIISVETTAEPATMSIKANKWGTFIAPFDVTIPSGVEAYTVTGVSGTNLVKEAVETTIPANTPVIVKNTTGEDITQTFSGVVHSNDSYTEGYLTGVYTAATIAASDGSNTRYVLQTQGGVQAFYKVASNFTATANKCYLTVPVSPAPVKAFFFGSDDADAIGDVRSKMEDGRNEIFNLAGQRMSKAQKGVNIVNGKKVLVK